ncbi:MAG TPA: MFS transporter [bacterium]|nr:MFS transporter [bacterium]
MTATSRSASAAGVAAAVSAAGSGSLHRRVTLLAGLAFASNGLNLGVLSFALPGLRAAWGLTPGQAGLLTAGAGAGQLIGGVVMGYAADWMGRRAGYGLTVGLSAIATGAASLAPSLGWLVALLFLAGVGFGGVAPVATSMVGEFAPREIRGALMGWTQVIWTVGWIVAAATGALAAHGLGWRVVFAVGAVPLVCAVVGPWLVPESPRFLLAHGRRLEAEVLARLLRERFGAQIELPEQEHASRVSLAARVRELWSPRFRRSTIMVWTVWWVMIGAYNGPVSWLPTMLQASGAAHAERVSLLFACAMIVPTIIATLLVDRAGRKPVIIGALVVGAVGAAVLAAARGETMLVLGGILMGGGVLAAWPVILSFAAELYPTRIRATATGWASAAGRTAGILSPALLGLMIGSWSSGHAAIGVYVVAIAAAVAVVLVFGEETAGRSLEDITGVGDARPATAGQGTP